MWSVLASIYLLSLLPILFALGTGTPVLILYGVGMPLLFGNLLLEGGARLRGGAWIPSAVELAGLSVLLLAPIFGVELGTPFYWAVYALLVAALAGGASATRLRAHRPEPFAGRIDELLERFAPVALSVAAVAYYDLSGFFPTAATIAFAFPAFRTERTASQPAGLFRLIAILLFLALLLPANPRRGETGLLALLSVLLLWVTEGGPKPARGLRRGVDLRGLKGLLSSFLIYYGIPFRLLRLRRFYGSFLKRGSLVFDVGAHLGNRVRAFRSLDARVVALEPQKSCESVLRRLYGDDERVQILPEAVGEAPGEARLYVAPENPTMSTLSAHWISRIQEHYPEQEIRWDRTETVRVTTLDELIERFGTPDFVKVDVEGFEPQVLQGLSEAVPALSFEFLPAALDSAFSCVRRLEELGEYEFNYSLTERMRLELSDWCDAEELRRRLQRMRPGEPSGDVYARRLRSSTR